MTTKPLYLEDAYLKTCAAKVLEVSNDKNNCKIILDQTIFYPEGGGQPADQGTIKTKSGVFEVNQVILKGDKIIHEGKLKGEIKVGDEVECKIDWARRYHNMCVHSAGHVLYEAVKELLPNIIPIGGQHGKKAFIKYQGKIKDEFKLQIKEKTNILIDKSLDVNTEFVSLDELKKRSPWIPEHLPTNKPLRIMWIGNYPPIPDGGTQVKSTSEIPHITEVVLEYEENNTNVIYKIDSVVKKDKSSETMDKDTKITTTVLLNLKNEALAMIMQAADVEEIERLRINYLGKSGQLAQISKEIKDSETGRVFNEAKTAILEAIETKQQSTKEEVEINFDIPGKVVPVGLLHPITVVAREMNSIFQSLGFSVADGPELENDEFNYNRLNLPMDHPARDLQDTLYIQEPNVILRTHTSSVEAHILADHKPPYRFVFPGKSYRYENLSAANNMMFFQYQGVAVGEGITMANLKSTLNTFIKKFFGPERKSRFRCKYYPEVEPGVGVDIDCPFCKQKGCAVCKNRGWIEMLGAGMIHPNMFTKVGLDPKKVSGFAWGMGLDRIVMARYGINDVRSLTNDDIIYTI